MQQTLGGSLTFVEFNMTHNFQRLKNNMPVNFYLVHIKTIYAVWCLNKQQSNFLLHKFELKINKGKNKNRPIPDKAWGSNSKSTELLKTFVKMSVLIMLLHDI